MVGSPLLNVMKMAAEKAGRAVARDFGEIENIQGNKAKLAVFLDHSKKNAEEVLLGDLEKSREGFGCLTCIQTKESKSGERWIINTLDGEGNFARGIPHWSISIALEDKTGVIAGVVYDVIRNEMYYAQKGYGAFVNQRRLKTRDIKEFDDTVVFSTFNSKACGAPKTRIAQGAALYDSCVFAIRSMGSIALDICYIAAGKGDLAFSNATHPCEVAAAGIIAKEAGLFVSSLNGDKDFIDSGNIVVAPPSLHAKAVKVLDK